jgi:hypothetical protein
MFFFQFAFCVCQFLKFLIFYCGQFIAGEVVLMFGYAYQPHHLAGLFTLFFMSFINHIVHEV